MVGLAGRAITLRVALTTVLLLTACAGGRAVPAEPGQASCATLLLFSDAIVGVMHMQPEWGPVTRAGSTYLTRWTVQDAGGSHELSVKMTSDGCICATTATSRFQGSRSQGELAGLMQGAAVAAVSDPSYTGGWLQPKIALRCPLAFLLRNSYAAEESMPDGTLWRLGCSVDPATESLEMMTSLSISKPACAEPAP